MTERIGLICGAGEFPVLLAKGAIKAGREVVTVGFKGITPPDIEEYSAAVEYFRLGKISPQTGGQLGVLNGLIGARMRG